MVNREVDSKSPPIPAVPIREVWQRSPQILPSQPRRYPPGGVSGFGQLPPRCSARITQVFGAGDRGSAAWLPSPSHRMPRRDSARAAGALFLRDRVFEEAGEHKLGHLGFNSQSIPHTLNLSERVLTCGLRASRAILWHSAARSRHSAGVI